MNSENSKTSKPLVLILCPTDKIDLQAFKSIFLSNLSIYNRWKKHRKLIQQQ